MRRIVLALSAALLLAGACTDEPADRSALPSPPVETPAPDGEGAPETRIEIYAAVIRQLITKDHTFGGGDSPFEHVYVVDGPIKDAGNPRRSLFEPAPQHFSQQLTDGIEKRLEHLPPLEFISDPRDVLRGRGSVRNRGVIISLGPVKRRDGKVHVSNRLWCGGLCGQWLTYVLRRNQGKWKITGTTGPVAIS